MNSTNTFFAIQLFAPNIVISTYTLLFRYLAVLKGRRFKSPKLSSQRVWSGDFYHFVTWTLNQNPSKRPTAEDVIRDSDFLKKPALGWCGSLTSDIPIVLSLSRELSIL